MGFVPMQMPAGAAQSGEPPSRPARPPRVPSGRLESIPEQHQVELGSSSQQDRPLPGIGFVTATMGQGPPPQGYIPPNLADTMAARAKQVLRIVPPRQRVDPDSPTTKLTDFLRNGGAARVANLEVMMRPPGNGPLYVEADKHGAAAAESGSPPSSPEGPASSGGKRRRAVTAHFTRDRRAKAASAATVEEELLRKIELHREQLANALAWLAHAVAERDHYSREKARLYDILERDRVLYEEAINTAPAASPPGSPETRRAAPAAASSEPPSPAAAAAPVPAVGADNSSSSHADDTWREWTRSSPLRWANASSPPPPPQKNRRRPLPSAPTTTTTTPGSPIAAVTPTVSGLPARCPSDRQPPRVPRAAAAAADKPPRHKAGMVKFRYAYGGSTAQRRQQLESHLAHAHQDEEARRRRQLMLPSTRPAAASPLRHEVTAPPQDQQWGIVDHHQQQQQQQQQRGDAGSPGWGSKQGTAKLPPLLPPFDGQWGNTGLNPILLAPDRRLLHAPF